MNEDGDLDTFMSRREFQAFANKLREDVKAEIQRNAFERERNHRIAQGLWVAPLPEENK